MTTIHSQPCARVLALYLPQYHPTEVNDHYWGKGFTEWTNVASAKPLYPGHSQPRIPADLGFYDLRLPQVREEQARMAREAGIEGFMYWHYWFGNGKTVLELPFKEVLHSGQPDFPFCLAWANHPWSTRTWRKGTAIKEGATIFDMHYSEDDFERHFHHCLPAFKDKRYVTVDGKPVFAVFSVWDFAMRRQFIDKWQSLATKNGLKGFYFIAMPNGRRDLPDEVYLSDGFDAVNRFDLWRAEAKLRGSLLIKRGLTLASKLFNIPTGLYDYRRATRIMITDDDRLTDHIPTILCGYDRTPRDGAKAVVLYNYTPETFAGHVRDVLDRIADKPREHRIALLRSWNEWGEGNYIEPDRKYGHQFLDALRGELFRTKP